MIFHRQFPNCCHKVLFAISRRIFGWLESFLPLFFVTTRHLLNCCRGVYCSCPGSGLLPWGLLFAFSFAFRPFFAVSVQVSRLFTPKTLPCSYQLLALFV